MVHELQIAVTPEQAYSDVLLLMVSQKLSISPKKINHIQVVKRSIDARGRSVKYNLKLNVFEEEEYTPTPIELPAFPDVSKKESVIIVGAGPAGLFAALQCIELGKRPVILERGKDVRSRRRDLKALNQDHIVNEDSNYCFGEI